MQEDSSVLAVDVGTDVVELGDKGMLYPVHKDL